MARKFTLVLIGAVLSLTAEADECPSFTAGAELGYPGSPELDEISGVAASRSQPGVLWVHNDSGDTARIFALWADGTLLGEYAIQGAAAIDWEDIALGPGPVDDQDYLYIGDVGDNNRVRENVQVYRIPEPAVDLASYPVQETVTEVETFVLSYPNAPATVYNCESLMIDPLTADLYLITKQVTESLAYVMRLEAPFSPGSHTLAEVASVNTGTGNFNRTTAADIAPDGNAVLLRTYNTVRLWVREDEVDLADVFARPPCIVPVLTELQGEAIGFTADSGGFFTLSEVISDVILPIYYYQRLPDGEIEGEDPAIHTADTNGDSTLGLSELLRIIQLYNARAFHCANATEDGFQPGAGADTACPPHDLDYLPQDWTIALTELSRAIQFYNSPGYTPCPDANTEDGFCPD